MSFVRPFLLFVCIAAGVAIIGCSKSGGGDTAFRGAAGGKYFGGVYRINETGDLKSLDPVRNNDQTSQHVQLQIFDLLFDFDADLNLKPHLVSHYEVSPDGRVYTMTLHRGVRFHDDPCFPNATGRELTAADVKFSYERVCDARTRTLGFDYFRGLVEGADEYFEATAGGKKDGIAKGVPGFVAMNDSTFQIRTTKSFAPFLYHLATGVMFIIPPEAALKYGQDLFQHPVGTGPFQFAKWEPGVEVKLARNGHYWLKDDAGNQLPYLDGMLFSFKQDEKTQYLEFKQGTLEESYRIPTEFFKDVVDENKKPKGDMAGFVLQHTPAMAVQFYGFSALSPIFKDKRIRQAFAYAVDRERIVRFVLNGQALRKATNGIVPPGIPAYDASLTRGYDYNPDMARTLLAEAGFPDGKNFPDVKLQLNAGGQRNVQVAEAIQGMIKENLGVNLGLNQVEWAQHTTLVEEGKAPFYRLGWVADYPEPENFLNLLYGKLVPRDDQPSSINSVRYKNPAFDALFETALTELDQFKRYDLYRKAEQLAMDDAPMLFIYYDEDYKFVQPYVMNYPINAMDRREFRAVWFDKAKYGAK
jgi:oligopeptide transport system substrate-binding protein